MKNFLKRISSRAAYVQMQLNNSASTISTLYFRLKRLFEFIPVIWNTWDFDNSATTNLMSYQLERTAKSLENGWSVDGKYHASRIRLAIKLFEYSENRHYQIYYGDMFENLYGKSSIQWKPFEGKKDVFQLDGLRWEKAVDDKHNREITEVYLQYMKLAEEKDVQAHKLAWRIVSENIRKWWD